MANNSVVVFFIKNYCIAALFCEKPSHTFELTLAENCLRKSDLSLVVDGMVLKKPAMQDVLRNAKLSFKVASAHFPDKCVDVG